MLPTISVVTFDQMSMLSFSWFGWYLFTWTLKFPLWENSFPQLSHLNGFSSKWSGMWFLKAPLLPRYFWHWSHWNSVTSSLSFSVITFSGCFAAMCFSKNSSPANALGQNWHLALISRNVVVYFSLLASCTMTGYIFNPVVKFSWHWFCFLWCRHFNHYQHHIHHSNRF